MKPPDAGAILRRLSPEVRLHTETLVKALRTALSDDLVAVLAHGSLARGSYDGTRSDIDLLVILARDDRATLERIGPAIDVAQAAAQIDCVLFHVDELEHAADVFPLLFDDVRRHHVVLYARNDKDPLAGLVITEAHRLLRVEQELRDLRIRLRRLTAIHAGRSSELPRHLRHKLRQLRAPVAALLRARGDEPAGDELDDVLAGAAAAWGLKLDALGRIDEDIGAATDALAALLDKAIVDVDVRGRAHAVTEGGPV